MSAPAKVALGLLLLAAPAKAQIAESREDPTGVSIPYKFSHLVHSADRSWAGATGELRNDDPFLFYQLGQDLVNRQFRLEQGVYGRTGEKSVPLYIDRAAIPAHGGSARLARDHTASCGFCHSIPYRQPGAGQTIASTGGEGRNTPHFYGGGLVEMLGEQVLWQTLERYDKNHDGTFQRSEVPEPSPLAVRPMPGAPEIQYGDLSPDANGVPRTNPVFRVWYVDASGAAVADATSLNDPRVAGFRLVMQPFGWGRGTRLVAGHRLSEGGEATTLRGFYTGAADVHMGLQAFDPTQLATTGGLARRSLSGAQQYDLGGSPDLGQKQTATGLSLDDPDGDGHFDELTEGDVDAAEFAMLHAPPPAVLATPSSEAGRAVLQTVGCTRCHVESWQIEAADPAHGWPGDRRFFHLEARSEQSADGRTQLVARLVRLDRVLPSGERVPQGGSFVVERIYTDFKQWDIGSEFWERRFDGSLQKEHRTTPLWGVGSTAPYGRAGRFYSLDAVISAHGGEATAEATAYRALAAADKKRLQAYLESLVLPDYDHLPADIDGDGKVAESFLVAGVDVGQERFDPRFLFATLPQFRVLDRVAGPDGARRPLMLIDNLDAAYKTALAYRLDSDEDGFPDLVDPDPQRKGLVKSDEPASATPAR